MEVSGQRILDFSQKIVYNVASDLAGIASEFKQVSNVEQLDDNTVRVTIHLDFGIYSGDYYADLRMYDTKEPSNFSIDGLHKSKLGGMMLNCKATLSSDDSKRTLVKISGDFDRSGMLRFANKAVVRKGVKFGIKLMFDTIERRAGLQT